MVFNGFVTVQSVIESMVGKWVGLFVNINISNEEHIRNLATRTLVIHGKKVDCC